LTSFFHQKERVRIQWSNKEELWGKRDLIWPPREGKLQAMSTEARAHGGKDPNQKKKSGQQSDEPLVAL